MKKTCTKCQIQKDLKDFASGRAQCKVCKSAYGKAWAKQNRAKATEMKRAYYAANKEKLVVAERESKRRRRKEDLNIRLADNLRNRLNIALKKNVKISSAVETLGCSLNDFKKYIESKFEPGMSWENWGHDSWHLDHIEPLSSFNLSDPIQFNKASHYTNFQPLWASDNLSKGAK